MPTAGATAPAPLLPSPAPRALTYSLVQGVHSLSWPVLAAIEQGYYARHGLTLELSYANSISEQTQTIASGSVDVGHTTPNPLIPAVDRGANMAAVGGLVNLNTYSFVVGPGLTGFEDVRGKQIVVSGPATFDALMSYRLLAGAGLTRDTDYSVLTLAAPPARFAALRNGQAAASLLP